MPYQLETPVLAVDREILHKVDAENPQNLFSMWAVFSKCADSVQQGRRLEYICWRYWNRRTICPESHLSLSSSSTPQLIPQSAQLAEIPQLSSSASSVESNNEEAIDMTSESSPVEIRTRIKRENSCANSRRSPASESFEKLVTSILESKDSLKVPPPQRQVVKPVPPKENVPSPLQRSGSTTTESSAASSSGPSSELSQASHDSRKSHSVVKGFSPGISSIARPMSAVKMASQPEPRALSSALVPPKLALKKQPARPVCGASDSSSEKVTFKRPAPRGKTFQLGSSESSEENESVKPKQRLPVFAPTSLLTETETDFESAIDEEDEWEDSDETGEDQKLKFDRVPSVVQLQPQRSLLTLQLKGPQQHLRVGNVASQSTSALRTKPLRNGPMAGSPNSDSDEAPLMMKSGRTSQLGRINETPRAIPQASAPMAIPAQVALSPRTTRRHMLATELTDSLRRHMVWERQYKHSTANAVLKRRHTSHDLANLKQQPEPIAYMNKAEDANSSSFNQFFTKDADSGYHAKGW